ncbi:MAG: type II toxin-antitoxin system Phd/YefM family antitoxin [Chloroflexota bacterium]
MAVKYSERYVELPDNRDTKHAGLERVTKMVTNRGGAFEMVQVGIAELKARLSEYLTRVKDGEEIVVTDRGRPVARLIAPDWGNASEEESRLLDLQRRGLLRLGTGVLPDATWEMERPDDAQGTVRAALEAERAEGY